MSADSFRKSVDESNGIVGTLGRGVCAETAASAMTSADDVAMQCFTINLLRANAEAS